ncbi:hypothetical protein [Paenibacillus cucumis (ex Kampfer et al. 2016)]|uniref:Uncharacterized protein n=1 Tax=Paenibacillus cucumis (ex Kampfer et al. 2016) TaxID=1776858 RepID=A0ABS7KK71_9BACL|nr:hypothetical protein [Paenibacillus cucumis (ex Kampfer et al. 2016)]MBY0204557.1 hypothetical protein [Paenibacillus cucumis (ex Kampfer et al. 2016)]
MNIEDVKKLPDRVSKEVLLKFFKKVLKDFKDEIIDKREFLLILIELTDRQVMTYELLEEDTRNDLDTALRRLWSTDSYEEVDTILSIVVNLGLEKTFNKIKESVTKEHNIDLITLNEIKETIIEVGDHISNPYYDLEKFKSSNE